jgi:succinyl-CoA synthetase alpha subunit
MAIIVDEKTRLIIQGITGGEGQFHGQQMIDYGTNVVAGVTPGKGGQECLGLPVFDFVAEAVGKTGANATIIYVPAPFAADAALEAIAAGLDVVVLITEGVPTNEMVTVYWEARAAGVKLVGPNCPGVISPGKAKVGIMPGQIHKPGSIGVISRSGTLTYEVVHELTIHDLGQSTCIGIGGDPIVGTSFIDALVLFEEDPGTRAVVLIGEIGGTDEEAAAHWIQRHMKKPVVSFIAGHTAPPGKRMGHAGAIISGGTGTAEEKVKALNAVGIPVATRPDEIAGLVVEALK